MRRKKKHPAPTPLRVTGIQDFLEPFQKLP